MVARIAGSLGPRRRGLTRDTCVSPRHGVFVPSHAIEYVESAGNYVRIHVGPEEHRLRMRLNEIVQVLDPAAFVRIHRTVVVNVAFVAEIQPWFSGDAIVILRDGAKLRLSRHYRGAMESTFGLTADSLTLDPSR